MDVNDDEIASRLRDLGEQAVEPSTAAAHLSAMASVEPKRSRRFGRLAVAGAALAGFALGGTGLAAAGAMPKPVEDAVNKVMEVTGFRNRGECVSQAARSGDQAAKDACPKGGRGAHGERSDKANREQRKDDGDPCTGPPAWAGRGRPTPEEKKTHASARAACPDDDAEDATADQTEETTTTTTTTTTTPTTSIPDETP